MMIHYGDITKIDGSAVPVVDIITGGSPCQDLSVAGKRAGLDGERSGLFMEQIRIVKEMRNKDVRSSGRSNQFVRPRFMVWENVPGAFSSNGGKDFQAVLTEIVRIIEPDAPDVPMPEKGRWPKAGCLYGVDRNWSIGYRVHDAQFWGVPQRRKRIALVADFGGMSAPEILFERKSLSGDIEQGETQRQGAAADVGRSAYEAGIGVDVYNQSVTGVVSPTLSAAAGGTNTSGAKVLSAGFSFGQSEKARSIGYQEECSPTLRGGEGGNQKPVVYDARGNGDRTTAPTITGDHQNRVTDYTVLCIGNGQVDQLGMSDKAGALNCMHDQQAVYVSDVAHALHSKANCQYREDSETYAMVADVRNGTENSNINGTMHDQQAGICFQNTGQGWWNESDVGATIRTPCGGDSVKANLVFGVGSIIRRLTPLECERLQGFPDRWTDIGEWVDTNGKRHKDADTPRYKALGNSIALPFWQWLARRIMAQYERSTVTMASLFDGIGGFPLVFSRAGCIPVWTSEIEEFPIAVTKVRFPE